MSTIPFRAVAFASLSAVAAFANVAVAVPAHAADIAPTATVRFADLDLATPAGVTALDRRIHAAARTVCGDTDQRELARRAPIMRCRTVALAGAAPQMAAAIERAQSGTKVASAMTLRVAAR